MASALYPSFKQLLLGGDIDLEADDIRAVLVDTDEYTYSGSHDFLNDVASEAVVEVSTALASKTITGGVFDAADKLVEGVTGAELEAVILYKHTGDASTSPLIAFVDGLSLQPNGGDVEIKWHASGIFAL